MIRTIRQGKSLIFQIALLAITLLAIGAGVIATRASPAYADGSPTAATASDVAAMSPRHPMEFQSPRYPNGGDSQSTRVAQNCATKGNFCGVDDNVCCSKQCTDCLENPHRCYCQGGVAPPSTATATVTVMTGDVSYREDPGEEWKDAVKGQKLRAGSEIHTGPDSEVTITFSDGSFVLVRQLTETAVGDLSAPVDRPKVRMLLKMGEIAAKVNHVVAQEADFAIRTPTATASVRGTVFVVNYDPEEDQSYVTVQESQVLVTPENTSLAPLVLAAGQRVWVSMEEVGPIENVPIP
jgi:hypothetical protein